MKKRADQRKIKLFKGLSIRENKKFFGTFVGLFAFIIIISSTLAWSSYSEWVKNHMQSNPEELAVKVTEKFEQGSILTFEKDNIGFTEKSVKVKNVSNRRAIIRVQFQESVMPFELDMSDGEGKGNANLKTFKKESSDEVITTQGLNTWKKGNLLDSGMKDGSDPLYYKATDTIMKEHLYQGESKRNETASPDVLKFFEWQLNSAIHAVPQVAEGSPYWVFDESTGYFYYSQVLEGGETTHIDLLQAVRLAAANIPNHYKFAMYDIQIDAEGVTASKSGLETWTSDVSYLNMYKEDARFVG